ncbi:signal peptidase I [Kitasatospora sp. CMC57]
MGDRGRARTVTASSAVDGPAAALVAPGGKRRRAAPAPSAPHARGRAERRRSARRVARRRRRSLLREIPLIAVAALVIALALKTFAVQVFVIPSPSMEQTILIGDRVLVDKLTPWFGSQPSRGEIVVFKDPGGWLEPAHNSEQENFVLRGAKQAFSYVGLLPSEDEQDLIKRVVGVPGDTVECCDVNGRLTVNGAPVEESYLAPGNVPSKQPFKVTVPAGRLWVMGDHRDVSADSRYHMTETGQGTIPMDNVVGRAFMIAWPVQRIGQLDVPSSLSALPLRTESFARSVPGATGYPGEPDRAKSPGTQPDLAEPPLVMGVLGVIPLLVRPRRARVRRAPPVG